MRLSLDFELVLGEGALSLTTRDGKQLTFSKEQCVQKKVTMVTCGELCDVPRTELAHAFGFATRKSYYDARQAVLHGDLADLIPKKPGPSQPAKRTRELEVLVIRMRCETGLSSRDIAAALTDAGTPVGPSLVAEILADYGLSPKKGAP